MPLILKKGIIGVIFINIPWNQIWKEPVKIIVENVFAICSPTDKFDEDFRKYVESYAKREILANFEEELEVITTLKKFT